MTMLEYQLFCSNNEHLHLPPWYMLEIREKDRLKAMNQEQLLIARTEKILSRDPNNTDYGLGKLWTDYAR